jgi:hypothetical protein
MYVPMSRTVSNGCASRIAGSSAILDDCGAGVVVVVVVVGEVDAVVAVVFVADGDVVPGVLSVGRDGDDPVAEGDVTITTCR